MDSAKRSSFWSLTINNPTPDDEEEISLARQKGWKVEGQIEVGENGTPHYQLFLSTGQVRFSAVKKAFSRAHIEPARNPAALKQYVHKEETRVGQLKEQDDKYPSLSKFWMLIFEYHYCHEKYAFDMDEIDNDNITFYDKRNFKDPRVRLATLDAAVNYMITQGYHVESIAINPSTRASFSRYGHSILQRCLEFKRNEQDNENASQSSKEEVISQETHQSSQA